MVSKNIKKKFQYFLAICMWLVIVQIVTVYGYQGLDSETLALYNADPLAPYGEYHSLFIEELERNFDFIFIFLDADWFLRFLYILIFMTFLSQVYTFLEKPKNTDKLSMFNLNAPSILGVIGTIYAFSLFLSKDVDGVGMITLFKENFNQAALTTLLGGITYVINLGLYSISVKLKNE